MTQCHLSTRFSKFLTFYLFLPQLICLLLNMFILANASHLFSRMARVPTRENQINKANLRDIKVSKEI